MEKPRQFDLFKEPEIEENKDIIKAAEDAEIASAKEEQEKNVAWEAEKSLDGFVTDKEKEEKKRLKIFIEAEKQRIFGKKDDELI